MVNLIAPLINISSPPTLDFGDSTSIAAIPQHLYPLMQKAVESYLIRHPAQYSRCLVVRDVEITGDLGIGARERLEEVVLRLRLYKPGGIGFNFAVVDKDGWYDDPEGKPMDNLQIISVFFYVVWERKGMPSQYELEPEDESSLRYLFEFTKDQKLMDKAAFRYFFRSYHEPYATDRFLSNAIALENLLANDQKDWSNIRYKFVDRGCFLLQKAYPNPDVASVYVKPLKDIYDARSRIVHATKKSNRDWGTNEEITILRNSEQFLRWLLRYILDHPEMEKSENVDKAKQASYLHSSDQVHPALVESAINHKPEEKNDQEPKPSSSNSQIEVLLKEYELCTNDANHLEEVIWTTAGVLITASIAGVGLLGSTIPPNARPYDYLFRAGIAVLSVIFVWSWRIIASRWYSIQRMMYYRIIEIEEELEMYKERYVSYLDKAVEGETYPQSQKVNVMLSAMRAKHRPGGVKQTVDRISWILTLVWVIFLLSQVAAMLGWI